MSSKRPKELDEYIENAADQNDSKILNALERIEAPENWKSLKPTVSTICKLTDLSRNTIRNRPWALDRLKSIKNKRKDGEKVKSEIEQDNQDKASLPTQLRSRIKALLEQNALLYQEILTLQETIRKKDTEIATLKINRRL